jgi:hypothetical protein
MILASIYGVFTGAVHMRDKATMRAHDAQLRQRAATVIRNDLTNGYISGGVLGSALEGSERGPDSRFPGFLRFTTTTGRDSDDELRGDVQEVSYYVVDDPDSPSKDAGMLVRAIDRTLLARVRENAREENILPNVSSFEISFYDGSAWSDTWNHKAGSTTLPLAVRVHIQQVPSSDKLPPPVPLEILVPWTSQPLTTGTASTDTTGTATTSTTSTDEEDIVPDQQAGEIAGEVGVMEGQEGEEDTSQSGQTGGTP